MNDNTSQRQEKKRELRQSGSTSFTFLSEMMGASLLSLPSLVQKIGLVYILVLYVSGVVIQTVLYQPLIKAATYTNSRTYRELVQNVIDKKNGVLLDIFIMINSYGVTTAYIIIAASTYISFFKQVAGVNLNSYLTKTVIAAVIFCLTLLQNLKQLGKIASIASVTIFVFAFSIIAYYFIGLKDKEVCDGTGKYDLVIIPEHPWYLNFATFLAYIPATSGSYTGHTLIPTVLYEMEGPAQIRQKVLVISLLIAMSLAMIMYLFSGIMGASMFGKNESDNVLLSFEPCGFVWIDILEFMYGLVVIIVYPLVIYPVKVSFCEYLPEFSERKVHLVVSIVFSVLSLTLAMFLEEILSIFGFFSSIAGFFMFFYYPLRIYAKLPTIEPQYVNDDTPADSVPIVIGSILIPGDESENLVRLRTLSDKSLPPVEAEDDKVPIGRRKSFSSLSSFSSHSENISDIKPLEAAQNEVAHEHSVDIIEEQQEQEPVIIKNKKETVVSWVFISIFFVICVDGAVVNFRAILDSFK